MTQVSTVKFKKSQIERIVKISNDKLNKFKFFLTMFQI